MHQIAQFYARVVVVFEAAHISLTKGVYLGRGDDIDEQLMAHLQDVKNSEGQIVPENGMAQGHHEIMAAMNQAE